MAKSNRIKPVAAPVVVAEPAPEATAPARGTTPCFVCGGTDIENRVELNRMVYDGELLVWDLGTCAKCGTKVPHKQVTPLNA